MSGSISSVTQLAVMFADIPYSQVSQSLSHGNEAEYFSLYQQCILSLIIVIM